MGSGEPHILPAGDSALIAEASSADSAFLHAWAAAVREALVGVLGIDVIPAYASLLVRFDPTVLPYPRAAQVVAQSWGGKSRRAGCLFTVPVVYGGEHGPDLDDLAAFHGIAALDVIRRHSAVRYRIGCIGFSPGFPYLDGLDPQLHTPRLASPRTRVPAGSVAIGGRQTGIYPTATPGGWHLIGRTPARLFDARAEPPIAYVPGDAIRFVQIDEQQFRSFDGMELRPEPEDAQ